MNRLTYMFIVLVALTSQTNAAVTWNNANGSNKQTLEAVDLKDDFEGARLGKYDQSHLHRPSIRFEQDTSGNRYVSLSSSKGQLSHFNRGQNQYSKDRVELGTKNLGDKIDGTTIWWGFRVRFPNGINRINAQNITFSQFKQIQKNASGKDCHPGMYWRMNYENAGTWYAVTDGNDVKYNKTTLLDQITDDWGTFKIGTYLSEGDDGWLKAYRNDKLFYQYSGRTIMNQFDDCAPKQDMQTYLRIGVYRGSPTGWKNDKSDTLYFDDFVISNTEQTVDEFHLATEHNPDGSSKRAAKTSPAVQPDEDALKANIIRARKNIRTNADFRMCLIAEDMSEDAINNARFRPASEAANTIIQAVLRTNCFAELASE